MNKSVPVVNDCLIPAILVHQKAAFLGLFLEQPSHSEPCLPDYWSLVGHFCQWQWKTLRILIQKTCICYVEPRSACLACEAQGAIPALQRWLGFLLLNLWFSSSTLYMVSAAAPKLMCGESSGTGWESSPNFFHLFSFKWLVHLVFEEMSAAHLGWGTIIVPFCLVLETRANLELADILWSQPSKCLDYRNESPHLASFSVSWFFNVYLLSV